jgi:hypothetical protein
MALLELLIAETVASGTTCYGQKGVSTNQTGIP